MKSMLSPKGLVATTKAPSSFVVFVHGIRKWMEVGVELKVMALEFRATWNLGLKACCDGIVSSPSRRHAKNAVQARAQMAQWKGIEKSSDLCRAFMCSMVMGCRGGRLW